MGGKGGAFDSGHASRWDWSTSSNPPNVIAGAPRIHCCQYSNAELTQLDWHPNCVVDYAR